MAKKKKAVVAVETKPEEQTELVAEEVKGEALPEITEETKDEIKEAPAEEPAKEGPKPKRSRKKAEPAAAEPKTGPLVINGTAWLYPTSVAKKTIKAITGEVYPWGDEVTGRIPVTKEAEGAGDIKQLLGWVDKGDIK